MSLLFLYQFSSLQQIFSTVFLLHNLFTNERFLFIPIIPITFKEVETNGKNQNETVNNNRCLNLTAPSGAVTRTRGTQPPASEAPSVWPQEARPLAFVIVWSYRWVSESQPPYRFISHRWKQSCFVRLVFNPWCLAPSSYRARPATQAFVQCEARQTG